jgi:pimeloyl-ACP methyl ester carboxylesterase
LTSLCFTPSSRSCGTSGKSQEKPATKVEIFKAAGHALFVDQPERLNKSIESFARSLSR